MTFNQLLFEEKMKLIKNASNPLEARSDLYLNFNWKVVADHQRSDKINEK
jgi:hypothetical protein